MPRETLLELGAPKFNGVSLPAWSYNAQAQTIAVELKQMDRKVALACMGPAVTFGEKANKLLWTFYVVYPWVVLVFAKCTDGIAEVPDWLLVVFLPVLLAMLYWEFQMLKFVLPAQLSWLSETTVFGKRVSFQVWISYAMCMSMLAHMAFYTNNTFVAKVVKTQMCPASVGESWKLAGVEIACILWFCGLLQLVWLLLQTVTTSPCWDDKGREYPQDRELRNWVAQYHQTGPPQKPCSKTCAVLQQTHAGRIYALADAARMFTVLAKEPDHSLMARSGDDIPGSDVEERCLKRGVVRAVLLLTLEVSFYLNLQAYILGISKLMSKVIDLQTAISIVIGAMLGIKNLVTEMVKIHSYYNAVKVQHDKIKQNTQEVQDKARRNYPDEWTVVSRAKKLYMFFIVVMIVTSLFLVRAGVMSVRVVLSPR